MGNVSACCPCIPKENNDDCERTHILNNPADGVINDDLYSRSETTKDAAVYGSLVNGSKQEQNEWNRTLHKMAVKVIDVASMDVPSIEQSECMERQRLYAQRINQTKNPILLKYKQNKSQLRNEPSDNKKVNVEPIQSEDVDLIKDFAERSYNAFKSGFVVNVNEELIVQFNP